MILRTRVRAKSVQCALTLAYATPVSQAARVYTTRKRIAWKMLLPASPARNHVENGGAYRDDLLLLVAQRVDNMVFPIALTRSVGGVFG